MRTIGLIGGMSWESTLPYYRIINEAVREGLGGLHSGRIILYSVDFHEIEAFQSAGDWPAAGRCLAQAGRVLEAAGAEGLVLCTNTMHKVAADIEAATSIPLLHIADPTAAAIREAGFRRVGLLGTRFTMEEPFYADRLAARHGIEALVPGPEARGLVNRIIYGELCQGRLEETSRAAFRRIIRELVDAGAEAVILGCTEISLLVGPEDSEVRLFDTTRLHARWAGAWAIQGAAEVE